MPLTKRGIKIEKHFEKEYGKVKGKQVFYATMNKRPIETSLWHKAKSYSRRAK